MVEETEVDTSLNLNYTKKPYSNVWLFLLEANGSGIFNNPFSRFSFQSFCPEKKSGQKGFPLQSGLKPKSF
jgi:hypothetical protein